MMVAPDALVANTVIGGQFVLRELIGSGGMGKVFRAEQKGVGRSVAVKIMHRHLLGDNTAAARFTNEARAASSLNHPHSIAILDFGQTEAGTLYIVMEYLRGRSLDAELRHNFPLTLGRVAHILCQALDAVEAAHQQHIIHRDLKPENVFLLENRSNVDFVKVLDFGIAKLLDHEDRSVTTPGLVPGTPEYMSPEQARGEKLDPRSDVYSLGVILYEMLTATVPFKGASAIATMMSHVQDPVEPPSVRRRDLDIPPAVDAVVAWALAKDPAERIGSARQFRDVLSAWAQVAGIWPSEIDSSASSPDVLLDFFSPEELDQMTGEVSSVHRAGPSPEQLAGQPAGPLVRRARRIIGRERELQLFETFLKRGSPRALRLYGDTGMGCTRIAGELATMAMSAGHRVLRCRADRGWVAPLLGVARRCILAMTGLDPEEADASKAPGAARQLGLPAAELPGLQDLLGLPSPLSGVEPLSRAREWAAAFRSLVTIYGKDARVLCLFEDWEQIDLPSRVLFRRVLAEPPPGVLSVVTHGPDCKESWPDAEVMEVLKLEPLRSEAAESLASRMFSGDPDTAVFEEIARASGGQPLFVEQLAFAIAFEELGNAPEGVPDLLAWRVDRLRKEDRFALQWLAVLNEASGADELGRLSGLQITSTQLDALVERGFLSERAGRFDYAHPLIGAVVYSSIPLEARREMHQGVAEFLREEASGICNIAHHSYQADDGRRAIVELERAGMWAESRLDAHGAVIWNTRALDLVRREWGRGRVPAEDLDEMAVDLALRLATVLRETNQLQMAEGILEEVLSVAAGHDMARARLRLNLGRIDMERGNVQRAVRHLQLAQADARAAQSDGVLGEITRELARARALMGEREVAAQLLEQSLEVAPRTGASAAHGEARWEALVAVATTWLETGFPERAGECLAEALRDARSAGSALGELKILVRMAEVHLSRAEWDEAEQHFAKALELVDTVGDRTWRAELLIQMGRVRRTKGNMKEGRKYLEAASELSQAIGWPEGIRLAQDESDIIGMLSAKE